MRKNHQVPFRNSLYYRRYTQDNDLNDFVKYAWIMKSQEKQSAPDLLIPDGYPEIIFVLQGSYGKAYLEKPDAPKIINSSCVVGIQTKTVLAHRRNYCQLVGLKLNPVGAHLLFGSSLKTIVDTNKPIRDFGVPWLIKLEDNLRKCSNDQAIINLLFEEIQGEIASRNHHNKIDLALSFLNTILSVKGNTTIQVLAEQHHLSIRQFQRIFKNCFGISPKKFLNIIRFKYLYKASILKDKPPVDYLAYGYYDQMHFIRDFRKHLGITPSKSANEAFLALNRMAQLNT